MSDYTNLPFKFSQILTYGRVVSTNDPLRLGRIRVEPAAWNKSDWQSAFKNPIRGNTLGTGDNATNEFWSNTDPFVFLPLLPYFFHQVPKVGELVHCVYYNNEYQDRNKFYIQGPFSSPFLTKQETFNASLTFTSAGERNKYPNNIVDSNGNYNITEQTNLLPDSNTVAILSRFNSDILLPENGVVIRSNKITGDDPQFNPSFNKKRTFIEVNTFPSTKTKATSESYKENNKVIQKVKYLIEYNVYGGLGATIPMESFDSYSGSGYVNVYKISDYYPVYTNSFENGFYNASEDSKIGPIYREDYTMKSFKDIINGINNVISMVNLGTLKINNQSINPNLPFVFQPEKNLYDKYTLSNITNANEPINSSKLINSIYLNKTDKQKGLGLVCTKGVLGPIFNESTTTIDRFVETSTPSSFLFNVSDTLYMLSHNSQIPGLGKIDFSLESTTGVTVNQDFIVENIVPNTSSTVRGEQLMNLIELIVKYLITHVHPYHQMPPSSITTDGTESQKILNELFSATEKILNKNIRIN